MALILTAITALLGASAAKAGGAGWFTLTIRLLQNQGSFRLTVSPQPGGGTCAWLDASWASGGSVVIGGCGPYTTAPDAVGVARDLLGNPRRPHQLVTYLKGPVGVDVARLDLLFRDGRRTPLPIRHHWVLDQLDQASFTGRHQPMELIGRDANGHVLFTRHVSW
jgi:hypothetical protein